jgi:hypothetical protein
MMALHVFGNLEDILFPLGATEECSVAVVVPDDTIALAVVEEGG